MFASRFIHVSLMGNVFWSYWYSIPISVDSTAVRLVIGVGIQDNQFAPLLLSPGIDIAEK